MNQINLEILDIKENIKKLKQCKKTLEYAHRSMESIKFAHRIERHHNIIDDYFDVCQELKACRLKIKSLRVSQRPIPA